MVKRLLLFLFCWALVAQNTVSAPITITAASGSTRFITASTNGKGTRIYSVSIKWDASASVYLLYGTGTNCGTSSVSLSGVYKPASGESLTGLTLTFGEHPLLVPPGNDTCVNFSTTVTGGGLATYDNRQ